MRDPKAIAIDISVLKQKMYEENMNRMELEDSEEYQALERVITSAKKEQIQMMKELPDSSSDYENAKQNMLEWFRESGQSKYANLEAKYKFKYKVHNMEVLDVLGGDMGMFQELIEISQKSLKEFAKDNPDLKRPLLNCVKEQSRQLSDLKINEV